MSNDLRISSRLTNIRTILVFSYVIFILFAPRLNVIGMFSGVQHNLRFEDILLPFMAVVMIIAFRKSTLNFIGGLLIYLFYCLAVTILGIIILKLPLKVILIWGKEFQYIIGLALFIECMMANPRLLKYFENIIIFAGTLGAAYLVYSLFCKGFRGYGVLYFTVLRGPSISAWLYFNLFFLCFLINKVGGSRHYVFRKSQQLIVILLFIGALASGTRTMFICGPLFLVIYWLQDLTVKRIISCFALLVIPCLLFLVFHHGIIEFLYAKKILVLAIPLDRASSLLNFSHTLQGTRGNSWMAMINTAISHNVFLFGGGRGFSHMDKFGEVASLGLGGDNQYTVNIAEIGLMGSVLFFLALISMYSFIHPVYKKFYLPYMITYLFGGMAMEIFQLSKSGQLFWIITAYLFVLSRQGTIFNPLTSRNQDIILLQKSH